MTDAREVIAQYLCDRAGHGWSGISPFERAAYRTAAHGMIATLAAAGFRTLGPDDVDPVTEVQGWRLVPEEPSDEMVEAVRKKQSEAGFSPDNSEWLRDNYSVMLAAAPTPPVNQSEGADRG